MPKSGGIKLGYPVEQTWLNFAGSCEIYDYNPDQLTITSLFWHRGL